LLVVVVTGTADWRHKIPAPPLEAVSMTPVKSIRGKPIRDRVAEIHAVTATIWPEGIIVTWQRGAGGTHRSFIKSLSSTAVMGELSYLTSRAVDDPELVSAVNAEWPRLRQSAIEAAMGIIKHISHCVGVVDDGDVLAAWNLRTVAAVCAD
jgi:hypothetical protein